MPTGWIIAVFLIFTSVGASWGSWLSRFPSLRDTLDYSLTEMSLVALSPSLGTIIGLLAAGRVVDALGSRRSLYVCLTTMAALLPLGMLLLVNHAVVLGLIVIFVYGFAFSTADVAMNVSGTVAERQARKPRMSLFHAGFSIGSVVALGLGSLAQLLDIGIVEHITAVSIFIFAYVMVALRFLPTTATIASFDTPDATPGPSATAPPSDSNARYTPWKDPRIVLLGVIALAGTLAEGVASDWLPLSFIDDHGLDNDGGVLVLALFYLGAMLARFTGDWLVTRTGRVRALQITLGIGIVGVLMVIVSPVVWIAVVGSLLWGIGSGLTLPLAMSAAGDRASTSSHDVATVAVVGYAAFVTGPVVFGFVGDLIGLRFSFLILVAVLVVGWALSPKAKPLPSGNPDSRTRRAS